jgi:uncharacterized protein DUF1684
LVTTSPGIVSKSGPAAGLGHIQQSYNDLFSCPLTPFENRLKVAVRAGEKSFIDSIHE